MNYTDYKFEIGDTVITVYGETGKIIGHCECSRCAERGYFEPIWVKDGNKEAQYITKYEADNGYESFYQIGKYYFNQFDLDTVLAQFDNCLESLISLNKQLMVIKETRKLDSRN